MALEDTSHDIESDPYAGYIVDDSDLEYSECSADESSEDEQVQRFQLSAANCFSTDTDGNIEDEFERDMNIEAERLLKHVIAGGGKGVVKGPGISSDPVKQPKENGTEKKEEESKFYDDVYFDSSDEDEGNNIGRESVKKKIVKLTDEELFYDPNMDAEDEKWVERQRQAYHNVRVAAELSGNDKPSKSVPKASGTTPTQTGPSHSYPSSDAVLNCPACMTTLCLDCQRHEAYSNQFRAMFVLNCKIVKDEVLRYCPKEMNRKRKIDRRTLGEKGGGDDVYRPVRCSACDTEVAVFDKEEIYHFFNVVAGAP